MRKGRGSGGITDPMINMEPGDNAKYLNAAMAVTELGKVKVDFNKPEEVKERIQQYFDLMATMDKKPTYTGLALALGVARKSLYFIQRDLPVGNYAKNFYGHTTSGVCKESIDLINQAVDVMTVLWEDYMQNGKINPASGIFLGKNFYNMRDEVEHIITPNTNPIDEMTTEDIAKRYLNDKNEK